MRVGDIIKLGRIEFIVLEMRDKMSQVQSLFNLNYNLVYLLSSNLEKDLKVNPVLIIDDEKKKYI
jgi:hypothetical protein